VGVHIRKTQFSIIEIWKGLQQLASEVTLIQLKLRCRYLSQIVLPRSNLQIQLEDLSRWPTTLF